MLEKKAKGLFTMVSSPSGEWITYELNGKRLLFILLSVLFYVTPVFTQRFEENGMLPTSLQSLPTPISSTAGPLLSSEAFRLIATLDVCNGGAVLSEDSDHNGLMEIIYERDEVDIYPAVFYENKSGLFTLRHVLPAYGPIWDVGDFNDSGKTDLITQFEDRLRIYEAPDTNSYPSNLVWETSLSSNIHAPAKGGVDLDQDGKKEIIVANNLFSIAHTVRIYENVGDNDYQLVFETPVIDGPLDSIVVGDFDNDGKMEFIASNRNELIIYENNGDNSYVETFRTWWGRDNGYATLGDDLDGNGKIEIILGGEDINDGCTDFVTIFESDGDNHFVPTFEIEYPYDGVCGNRIRPVTGKVIGDGSQLVVARYQDWHIYKPTEDGRYEEIYYQEEPSNIDGQIFLVDLDGDGHKEIVVASRYIGPTIVYQYVGGKSQE